MRLEPLLLFPALLLSAAAPTAQLRKCVGVAGAVSYQSVPCAQGSRQAWVQPIKSEPTLRRARAPEVGSGQAKPKQRAGRVVVPRRPSARDARRARCAKARQDAARLRDQLWNKLDFQQRSDLDAKVARACARRQG